MNDGIIYSDRKNLEGPVIKMNELSKTAELNILKIIKNSDQSSVRKAFAFGCR